MERDALASWGGGLRSGVSSRFSRFLSDKRLVLVVLVAAGIAVQFWAGSRVPALNEKALMGGDTQLGALGFDTVFQVSDQDPFILQVIYETVNWLKTNQRGMTFGIIFAATLLLLLTLIKNKSFRNPFANSLMGMVIGAPLGVCVNCAAPIAKGLYTGGARMETTIAAMISSPTLNIIVVTMLLSLFPFYIVVIKLGLTIGFIVLMVPLMTALLAKNAQLDPAAAAACPLDLSAHAKEEGNESWGAAVVWVIRNWLTSFWHVFKTTVPLMFLAGFLGALLVSAVPWSSMADIVPQTSGWLTLAGLLLLSLVGIFLPVPIAFDVIVAAILLGAGMPVKYIMVLLFTLGIYSCYSFFIIWREVSRPMAVGLFVVLTIFGVGAGVIADRYYKWDYDNKKQVYFETFREAENPKGPSIYVVDRGDDVAADPATLEVPVRRSEIVDGTFPVNISVARVNFRDRVGGDATPFTRMLGGIIGIDHPFSYSVEDAVLSLTRFRGIASGDIHNDGWPDLLMTGRSGLSLFANHGDGTFAAQRIDAPDLAGLIVVNAALVDLDSDGWLDIVLATYRNGNFVILNDNGEFSSENLARMPNHADAILTGTMGFGDIDRDGDLDVVFGNYGLGTVGLLSDNGVAKLLSSSRDALLINEGGEFTMVRLGTSAGDSMSSLLSDYNGDGILDLIIGNDSEPSDLFFIGDGAGNFRPVFRQDGMIPHTGSTTMNIVSADINNDLTPEIFIAQISGRAGRTSLDLLEVGPAVCEELAGTEYYEHCKRILTVQSDILSVRRTRDLDICARIDSVFHEDCVATLLFLSATRWDRDEQLCNLFPAAWHMFRQSCFDNFGNRMDLTQEQKNRSIPQKKGTNVLLFRGRDAVYEDRSESFGLQVGGWSWNARFSDLDNDEWQDMYIVNGDFLSSSRESNFFYHNDGGNRFVDATAQFGLQSQLATSGYTYVDMDNDGDLDIVSIPAAGPIFVYRNNLQANSAIAMELQDFAGNRSGVGSIITIHYGPSGERHQMREIQASGGFVSFDAPVAHFGLGDFEAVDRVEVRWSTGEISVLNGPFEAGARYTVTRHR